MATQVFLWECAQLIRQLDRNDVESTYSKLCGSTNDSTLQEIKSDYAGIIKHRGPQNSHIIN